MTARSSAPPGRRQGARAPTRPGRDRAAAPACVRGGRRGAQLRARRDPLVRVPARPEPADPQPGTARRLRPAAPLHAPGRADAGRRRAARPGAAAAHRSGRRGLRHPLGRRRPGAPAGRGVGTAGRPHRREPRPAGVARCRRAAARAVRDGRRGVGAAGDRRWGSVAAALAPAGAGPDGPAAPRRRLRDGFRLRLPAPGQRAGRGRRRVRDRARLPARPRAPVPGRHRGRGACLPLDARLRGPRGTDRAGR